MKKIFVIIIISLITAVFASDNLPSKNQLDTEFNENYFLTSNYSNPDVGVSFILNPGDTVDSNTVFIPEVVVRNYGDTTVSFQIHFKDITYDSFYEITQVNNIPPYSIDTVRFNRMLRVSFPRGSFGVKCSTALPNDVNNSNDAYQKQIICRVRDIVLLEIFSPDTVDSGTIIIPRARIRNSGNVRHPFWATFKIGSVYSCSLALVTPEPGYEETFNFDPWAGNMRGTHAVSCFADTVKDIHPENNVLYSILTVRVMDFGLTQILQPTPIIPEYSQINPKVLVTNFGNLSAAGKVFFTIINSASQTVYSDSNDIILEPEILDTITFPTWSADSGRYTAITYTKLNGDINPNNDTIILHFFAGTPIRDVGVTSIISPTGSIERHVIIPKAEIGNFGDLAETFFTYFKILDYSNVTFYHDSLLIENLTPDSNLHLIFSSWNPPPGDFVVQCYTTLLEDMNPDNNFLTDSVTIETLDVGWSQRSPFPDGNRSKIKKVKHGGALVYVPPNSIYAFKGNNTTEFYCYDIIFNTWTDKETIPFADRKKRVKAGASLCYDGEQFIYAIKGNNTFEFWRYNIISDSWRLMRDVPTGTGSKIRKVKYGAGLVFVTVSDTRHFVYLLKGNRTFEFYAYSVEGDTWITKPDAPSGESGKQFKKGSCITYDRDNNCIWALKGKYNEYYAYDLENDTWLDKPSLPFVGTTGRKKKAKDGAALAYCPSTQAVYALKGGNTNEFWRYIPGSSDTIWDPMEDMPVGTKKVKAGGSLVYAAGNLYALRGNKTMDFFVYNFGSWVGIKEPNPTKIKHSQLGLKIQPNPFSRTALILYSINGPMGSKIPVTLKLYNLTGRVEKSLVDDYCSPGLYEVDIKSTDLPNGIYFIQFKAGNLQTCKKVIITR
ncbi:MAG: T9SS type A sorting domain-containing protein [candidate division WOR-3 bacterium]|nr:T9SS type A sorting domain-containing protein [candidate division WOR-3 bacterium]